MKSFILIAAACLLQTAFAAPQLISFKDGRVGVNILGYHAEAGLGGGGQNGGLLGGLHASAGTPWGQNAAAGLGGNVNGRAAGLLYAGAQATPDVGTSAVLGGDTSRGAFSATDAYNNGKVSSSESAVYRPGVRASAGNTRYHQEQPQPQVNNAEAMLPPPQHVSQNSNAIQKIRPHKKYHSSEGAATKGVENPITIETAAQESHKHTHLNAPQTLGQQLFSNDADIIKNTDNYEMHRNLPINIKNLPSASSSASSLLEAPNRSYISSLIPSNNDDANTNENLNGKTAIASTIITRDHYQLGNRKHRKQHHHHQRPQHPKRIHLNQRQRQRERSKTIVRVVEEEQQQHQPEELFVTDRKQEIPQINHQQHHAVRRQFIAPAQASANAEYPAPPCNAATTECAHPQINRPVRSEVVQSALQIPIGILQSLQYSLGNLGVAPAKGY